MCAFLLPWRCWAHEQHEVHDLCEISDFHSCCGKDRCDSTVSRVDICSGIRGHGWFAPIASSRGSDTVDAQRQAATEGSDGATLEHACQLKNSWQHIESASIIDGNMHADPTKASSVEGSEGPACLQLWGRPKVIQDAHSLEATSEREAARKFVKRDIHASIRCAEFNLG